MLCEDGPKVVEYNARFGDPEAMNVLPLLETNIAGICQDIVDGTLKEAKFKNKASVCKYIVPEGYPETKYADTIIDIDEESINKLGAKVFYAAVNQKDDGIYTSSSRALGVVAQGETIAEAEEIVEKATEFISGKLYHRRDVATQEIIQKRIDHMNELR